MRFTYLYATAAVAAAANYFHALYTPCFPDNRAE